MAAADNGEKEEQLQENDAAYDNPTTLEEKNLKFNFEQNVIGTGFFSANNRNSGVVRSFSDCIR
jgi:hypothetical protein